MRESKWLRIGTPLMLGLFVAYLDRTTLSVALPSVAEDLGFAGERFSMTAGWALTAFLIGYAVANFFGGMLTRNVDAKKVVIWTFAIWSAATVYVGFTHSLAVLLACRVILGVAEGVYWPQQSRFAKAWFAPSERTKANAVVQYYGQFGAMALGFILLTPLYNMAGWRAMFIVMGAIGLVGIVPLFIAALRPESEAPYAPASTSGPRHSKPLTFASLGGYPFLLLLFSYVMQGMLFWGVTLWIPLAVKSVGFSGMSQAVASSLPYVMAVVLAWPISRISDRTGKRVLIASLGLLIPGVLMMLLPTVDSGYAKLALITLALGYYASSYSPNIWSILQSTIEPESIGTASGIINGIGAGGGGTLAGLLVGALYRNTGSYMPGFVALGALVILGGLALLAYGRLMNKRRTASISESTTQLSP
ncbi:Sugar transport-related, membrane protein [Paraburkholderia sabiae]|uniref:MFS transporter n=1 Tax=Paraburkholderia sabiae TaxID=273251 RepID=UPI001CADAA96|nr:MFS transporter [Paraburkholderia sabiae]CAG9194850.1 Sugar transport-related, membrane protein [Paraburkholderia sabiae]